MNGVRVVAIFLALAAGWVMPSAADEPSSALWRVVRYLCLTDETVSGLAAPCLAVDRAHGYAIVPDPKGQTQILLVPTRRLNGIESPELLNPNNPNYFQFAWNARRYLERRAGRPVPRDAVGLAINSSFGRTQDQLHIHVDCVRPDVLRTLKAHQPRITGAWSPFPAPLAGHRYRTLRLLGDELGDRDPFKLLAAGDPAARADMGRQTLAVIGASFAGRPGFVLLAATGDTPENPDGASEDLLDHTCAVLRPAPGA